MLHRKALATDFLQSYKCYISYNPGSVIPAEELACTYAAVSSIIVGPNVTDKDFQQQSKIELEVLSRIPPRTLLPDLERIDTEAILNELKKTGSVLLEYFTYGEAVARRYGVLYFWVLAPSFFFRVFH